FKVEGKGNGIKTVIVNVTDIAKALYRKPIYEDEHSPVGENGHCSPVRAYDGDDDDDVDWGEDTTEEAQQQRLGELSALARRLALSADVEKSDSERADIFLKQVDQMKKKGDIVVRAHDLKMEAERLKLGSRAVLVVAEVLLSDPNTMLSDISTYRSVFIQFTRTGEQAQKAQAYVLGAMSIIIDKNSSSNLMDKACHILKSLYDCDIVEEEVILSWFEKNSPEANIESGSDSVEDDDDDIDIDAI
ncbi:unnamed protein product, partial [Dibothriocephalus latus]